MTKAGRYAAVIMAAGFSSRMEKFKPLLEIGEETVADRVISAFAGNDIDVFLVTGWRRDELAAGIESRNITIVDNPDYESGMFSSVQAGVNCLRPEHQAFFIMPVDIPLVRPATVKRLMDIAAKNPDMILYPVFNGTRGHPPLIPASLVPEIRDWQKGGGLEAVLALHPELDMEVPVADENILLDIDTQEDYSALLERFRDYDVPTEDECVAMLDIAGTPDNVRWHCRRVAEIAVIIAEALNTAGYEVNTGVVRAAAVLHDIAKKESKHDITGGRLVRGFGFAFVGDIIAVHGNLNDGDEGETLEAKIVFLADKFVRDEEIVSIDERYSSSEVKYGHIPGIEEKIARYRKYALRVKEEIERLLGFSLDDIVIE